jgi:hypothetical protein
MTSSASRRTRPLWWATRGSHTSLRRALGAARVNARRRKWQVGCQMKPALSSLVHLRLRALSHDCQISLFGPTVYAN